MAKIRKYYYKTATISDYTYDDYLEFCKDNEIDPKDENSIDFEQWLYQEVDWDNELGVLQGSIITVISEMIDIPYDEAEYIKCYLSSENMGWRNQQAETGVCDAYKLYEKLLSFDHIEIFKDEYEDGVASYGIICSDHDGTNYLDIVPIHAKYTNSFIDSFYLWEKLEYLDYSNFNEFEGCLKDIVDKIIGNEYYVNDFLYLACDDLNNNIIKELIEYVNSKGYDFSISCYINK